MPQLAVAVVAEALGAAVLVVPSRSASDETDIRTPPAAS